MAVNGSNSFFVCIALAVAAGATYLTMAIKKQRRDAMSAMAARLGLQPWPDNIPPRGLALGGTPFEKWTNLSNIHEGILNRRQVAVLDCRKQERKSGWSRSIIAVKSKDEMLIHKPLGLELTQVGDWKIIYSPVGFLRIQNLMGIQEIENIVQMINRQ